ncbi:MAG: phosphoribosylformylglycinamidine synthase subunit PurS [Sumerlaeia bacterium]
MKFHVLVHLKPDVLDVQGQAIREAVVGAGHGGISAVRVGKSFYLDVAADSDAEGRAEVARLCQETLSNPLLETFEIEQVTA